LWCNLRKTKGEGGEYEFPGSSVQGCRGSIASQEHIGDYELLKRQEWALTWAEREMMKETERGEDWTP
jgi:hypothetical protein